MSWTTVKIGDLGRIVTGKTPPTKQRQYYDGEYPFITPSDLDYDSFRVTDTATTLSDEARSKFPNQFLPENAVIFTCIASVGKIGITTTDSLTNQQINSIVVSDDHDWRFVYYLLRQESSRIQGMCSGVAVPIINKGDFENVKVKVPNDLTTERHLASILSAYDELIENNRRRIQLLEQAARLLYKEWFVHLRFPGHERIPVTNGMPEGWKRKSLGEVLVYLESGGRPKGGAKEEGIPSIGAENVIGIGQYDYAKEKYVSEEYFGTMRKGVVRSRDVVVYKDGANIGRSSYFGDGFPHKQCAVNEHVFILRAVPEVGQNLLYFWVAQDETRQHIANLNANTAQPGISQGKMKTLTFPQPQQAIARLFNETVEPVVRQIFLLAREKRMLSHARDLLLPRLMKGDTLSPIA